MKERIKVTKKMVNWRYSAVYQAGYCDLAGYTFPPVGYSAGVYGWSYGVMEITPEIAVTTGYRGMFGKPLPPAVKIALQTGDKSRVIAAFLAAED